jgi:MoxR-like ATPase
MIGTVPSIEEAIGAFQTDFQRLTKALATAIVGQDRVINELLTAILAGGHVLIEGLPGLGKTQMVKALARAIGEPLARIQCTPDLLPGDITGSEMLVSEGTEGQRELRFRAGPIFGSLVLVDEINRATPRTQSALLEAMQERQVTYAGTNYPLPFPFWIVATQNPIELEGTYPLPEAQLDRFLFKSIVAYPSSATLHRIADVALDDEPATRVEPVLSAERIAAMMRQTRDVVIADDVKRAAVDLVQATQKGNGGGDLAAAHVRYGASPRAVQALLRGARVLALADGRGHVAREDVGAVALPALRHRVLLSIASEVDGLEVDQLVERIVERWAGSA